MNDEKKDIPYIAYEDALMVADKSNRRLWCLCILLIVLLIGSNAGWIYYESQFTDVITEIEAEQEADGYGRNYIVGGDYGNKTKSENDD